jgi:hypothetical protein
MNRIGPWSDIGQGVGVEASRPQFRVAALSSGRSWCGVLIEVYRWMCRTLRAIRL